MEGVLETTLFLCVCKLMCSMLVCLPAARRTVTAVSLCSGCLLLFTDLAITLFLAYVWFVESWLTPLQLSSDVIALRFLLFLCQAYGVVLLLTPPLIAVELLVHLLYSQGKAERTEDTETELDDDVNTLGCQSELLSRTVGLVSCLLVWIVSGIYSRNNWMLGQLSVEACLERGTCLINCLPGVLMAPSPGMEELSWFFPAMVLLLSLTGGLGLLKTKAARGWLDLPGNTLTNRCRRKYFFASGLTQILQPTLDKATNGSPTQGTDSIKTPNSCAVHRAGSVYNQEHWFCAGNVALCSYQTGLADSCIPKQKQLTSHAPFLQSKTKLPLEVTSLEVNKMFCDYKKTDPVLKEALQPQSKQSVHSERKSPCLGGEVFIGIICIFLCVFPTVVSGNILLILTLETLLVYTVKLLSLSAHRVPIL